MSLNPKAFRVNKSIELHDSRLDAIITVGGETIVSLSPAYVHSSEGRPGIDAGSGWLQSATLALGEGTLRVMPAHLPVAVAGGFIRIGSEPRDNMIPIGIFEGPVEISMVLVTGETLRIRGQGIRIELHGEPSFVEDFYP